ncbi:hypothetical protein GYMLUDRAFT_52369 [Collybiopsis luxurians FD-317 M1]|nr:hypothetical protein GYMLUDRAFT_52369 [Collybiopsis luxurians FD-317 M1]
MPVFSPFCRLHSQSTDLILSGCAVDAVVTDVHVSVDLAQKFTNPTGYTLNATYSFGMMSEAAVCGFAMTRKDGTRIEGIVKDKDEANREFRKALSEGKTASLGQEESHDVFSISVGHIHPHETVTINLQFIQTLIDDENNDEVRFIFPRTYAQRYGAPPSLAASAMTTAVQPFKMKVVVQQAGPIKSISCPSGHPISFSIKSRNSALAEVTLKDNKGYLTQDVILVVSAANLDSPRCFIETHPSPEHATTAVALTFVPRFELPDVEQGMEYILMIDRSGSMAQNLRLLKDALVVLLKSLPTKDTTFNLVSFGSHTTMLWERSKAYSQSTVEEAIRHIDSMDADYLGTEIPLALRTVFRSLSKPLPRPASVFLLTDGSSWDVSASASITAAAVRDLPGQTQQSSNAEAKSFLRVFTMGIGAGASSDMCNSIARAGNGMAVYVQDGEEMIGKCTRLVRAARTPPIDIEIEWMGAEGDTNTKEITAKEDDDAKSLGSETNTIVEPAVEPPTINLFKPTPVDLGRESGPPPESELAPPPTIQQAPLGVTRIFPGTRTCIYAILKTSPAVFLNLQQDGDDGARRFIKLRGKVPATSTPVRLEVPIVKLMHSQFSSSSSGVRSFLTAASSSQSRPFPFLHTLAAKALITDCQDGKHAFPTSIVSFKSNQEFRKSYLRKEIVRLGTTYGLTSEYTSFIAVDHSRSVYSVSRESHASKRDKAPLTPIPSHSREYPSPRWAPSRPVSSSAWSSVHSPAFENSRPSRSYVDQYDPTIEDIDDPALYGQEEYGAPAQPRAPSRTIANFSPDPVDAGANSRKSRRSSWFSASFGTAGKVAGVVSSSSKDLQSPVSTRSKLRRHSLFSIHTPFSLLAGFGKVWGKSRTFESEPSARPSVSTQPLSLPTRDITSPAASGSTPTYTNIASANREKISSTMNPGERLAAVARLQRFDGGFVWSMALFTVLEISIDITNFDVIKKQLETQGISNADIAATVLAWVWLQKNGGENGFDMARKAEEWVGLQLAAGEKKMGVEKEALKKVVLGIVPQS